MAQLSEILRVEKLRVDVVVAQQLAEENERIRARMERDRVRQQQHREMMAFAPQQEQDLDGLLQRVEELQTEISHRRGPVMKFLKPPHSVDKKAFEEAYLYLKELVHNNEDLETHKEDMHSYVVEARVGTAASGLLPLMLDLMVVENELVEVNRSVQRMLEEDQESMATNFGRGVHCVGQDDVATSRKAGDELSEKRVLDAFEGLQKSQDVEDSVIARVGDNLRDALGKGEAWDADASRCRPFRCMS